MKKTLAILLSVLMVVCMMPGMAFAEETGLKVEITNNNQVYTGEGIKPILSVTDGEKSVEEGNYTVSYKKNDADLQADILPIDAGEYTVTVTVNSSNTPEQPNVTAMTEKTATATFTIKKAQLSNTNCERFTVKTTDNPDTVKSKVALYFNGKLLDNSNNKVFDVTDYPSTIKAGNNSMKLTAAESSNFEGEKIVEFKAGIDISDADNYRIITSTQDFIYNGFVQSFDKVDVQKKVNDSTWTSLPAGSFSTKYDHNTEAMNSGSPNCPKVIVEGAGEYVGTLTKEFDIKQFNLSTASSSKLIIEDLGTVIAGSSPTPKVYIKSNAGQYQLKAGVDFDYSYQRLTNEINVIITACKNAKNVTGTASRKYSTGNSIENATVILDNVYSDPASKYPKYTYNGNRQQPKVEVRIGGTKLSEYYYTTTYENDINASTSNKPAKVIVTGKNGYAGKIQREYTIEKKSITNSATSGMRLSISSNMASIPLNDSSVTTYMPDFTLYDVNGRALVRGTDYYVSSYSYTNDTTKSAVNITLTGKGNYDGYYSAYNVVLNGTSMANCRVELSQTSYKYTGYAHTPTVKVYNGSTLVPSTYYIVSYKNNKEIGTASVTVTGTNGYTGSQTAYFTITGNSINDCTINLSQTKYTYDGSYKYPTVTVKDGYTTLRQNTDYTLTYNNNRVAGTASVVIKGMGKYSGTVTKEFIIDGLDQTVKTKYTKYTRYPTSSNFRITATANGDGTGFTYTSSDPSVAKVYSNGEVEIIGTGIAKITVATKGTTRYNPASKEIKITVKPNKPVIKVTSPSKGKVKVLITKVKGATKYQVKYGRNDNYYNKYITHKENEYTKTSTTIKNRKSGVYYYVKVRAYKTLENGDKVWGNWTTLRKVRAK